MRGEIGGIRAEIGRLRDTMDARFDAMDAKFSGKFEVLDRDIQALPPRLRCGPALNCRVLQSGTLTHLTPQSDNASMTGPSSLPFWVSAYRGTPFGSGHRRDTSPSCSN